MFAFKDLAVLLLRSVKTLFRSPLQPEKSDSKRVRFEPRSFVNDLMCSTLLIWSIDSNADFCLGFDRSFRRFGFSFLFATDLLILESNDDAVFGLFFGGFCVIFVFLRFCCFALVLGI